MPLRTMEVDEDGAKPPPLPSPSVPHRGSDEKDGAHPIMNPLKSSMMSLTTSSMIDPMATIRRNPMASKRMHPMGTGAMGMMNLMALKHQSHIVTSDDAAPSDHKVVRCTSGRRRIEDPGDEEIVFHKRGDVEGRASNIKDAVSETRAGEKELETASGPPAPGITNGVSEPMAIQPPPPVPGSIRHNDASPPYHSHQANDRTSLKKASRNADDTDGGRNTETMRTTWRSRRQQELTTHMSLLFGDDQTATTDSTSLQPGAVCVGNNESETGTVQVGDCVNPESNYHMNNHGDENDERNTSGRGLNEESDYEDRAALGYGERGTGLTPEERSSSLNSVPLLEAEVASEPVMAESVQKVTRDNNRRNKVLGACFIVSSLVVIVAVVTGINTWKKNQESTEAFHSVEEQGVVVIRFEELTVVIQLDGKPEETGWSLSCGDSFEESEIGFSPGVYEGRSFDLVVHTDQIAYEGECTFTIVDEGGDGIEGGYFEIYKGDDITDPEKKVIEGSGFTDSMTVTFSLDSPTPSASPTDAISQTPSLNPTDQPSMEPTPAPSHKPTPKPSPLPTVAPTPLPTRPPSPLPTPPPSQPPSTPPTQPPTLSPTCPIVPPFHPGLEFLVTQSITILRRDGMCLSEQDLVVLEDGLAEGYNTQHQSLFGTCSADYRYIISSVAERSVLLRCQERKLLLGDMGETDVDLARKLRAMAAVPFGVQIRCTPDAVQCSFEDFVDTRDGMIGVLEESGTYIVLGFDFQPPTISPTTPPTLLPTGRPSTPPTMLPTTSSPTPNPSSSPSFSISPSVQPSEAPSGSVFPSILPSEQPSQDPTAEPTPLPTCLDISSLFHDRWYKTVQGGEDASYTIECGGETDIAVFRAGDACIFTCVGSLPADDYEDVCDLDDILEFMLEGGYSATTLHIGYLDDIYEASDFDCPEEIEILNSSEDDASIDDEWTGATRPSDKNNKNPTEASRRRGRRGRRVRRVKINPDRPTNSGMDKTNTPNLSGKKRHVKTNPKGHSVKGSNL